MSSDKSRDCSAGGANFDFDLLGDPVPEGFGRRGRPPHTPTDEKRRLVVQLLAFDWSPERIAASLNITPPTLRKHYFSQLKLREEARARVEAKLLSKLMAEAEAGNVSAIDKYFKRLDRHDMRLLADAAAKRGNPQRSKPLGKKEQQLENARSIGGRFAPPMAPGMLPN